MSFLRRLERAWSDTASMLCVGLDPDPALMPAHVATDPDGIESFCREIIDATAPFACAFKPQIAYFAAARAESALEALGAYVAQRHPDHIWLLDAKRGDIGPTAVQYAREAFERYRADAVTVNPYLGTDAVEPFLAHEGRGVVFLCRTSNPGGADFQSLEIDGRPLYCHVAERVASQWSQLGECGLVVGGTYPGELGAVRAIVGDAPILVPGIGAQGGDIAATVAAGATGSGRGLLISSSRAILYASRGHDFAAAAADVAKATRDTIRAADPAPTIR